jgi:DNA-directed RNA polymerase specialized sigma24 family protein/CheY-like chemotaxis protein
MSLASTIRPHIPYLRRFARALTGSQESGDRYVEATIEALVDNPDSFPERLDPRTGLFKVFLDIWNSIDLNQRDLAGESADIEALPLDKRLAMLTPRPRQAFLLVYVEDFSPQCAAAALGLDTDEVQGLVDQAKDEMASLMSTTVLIIEDEPLIAADIEDIVTSLGHTTIGIARTRSEAVKKTREQTPGLVLADIQLADGSSGIDAVNEMLADFEAPVIFITAYPERLLTGTRPEPTFLMTKPFQPAALKAVISQALFFEQKASARAGG